MALYLVIYQVLSYLPANKRLVYEEVKKAVERDRSMVKVSELSRHGLMEITRKRVNSQVLSPEDALRQQSWQTQRGAKS